MVFDGFVVALHERVDIAQTVAGLGLKCTVSHLTSHLQCIAE